MALLDVNADSFFNIGAGPIGGHISAPVFHSATLTGTTALDATYPAICQLDPGGAARDVTLDAERRPLPSYRERCRRRRKPRREGRCRLHHRHHQPERTGRVLQRRCAGRHRVRVGAHRNLGHRSLLNHPDA